ncbi:MAG: ABC transporter ATP-binding protein [Chloroflexi bacterium]|nr:ABC transporter ATP-binding protein [Chloroflexota bacterium]MDA1147204.1 ABC transporter ATP-binding protein [Chloroflexota bacterium]
MTTQTIAAPAAASRWKRLKSNQRWHYLRMFWRQYALGLTLLTGAAFLSLMPPIILRDAIDGIDNGTTTRQLATFGLIILGLASAESAIRFVGRLLVSNSARRIEYHLRTDLSDQFMRLDRGFFLRSRTGDLMARATNDLQWVRDLLGPTFNEIWRTVIMVSFGIVLLLTIDVRLTLIAIAYMPFIAGMVTFLETGMERRFIKVQDQFGVLTNRVQENISGIRSIKAYAQEDAEVETFAGENREMMRRSMSFAYYSAGFFPAMIFATGLGTGLVLWFGGRSVVDGDITLGQFVQFNTYLALLSSQLAGVGWFVAAWQQGTASMQRIAAILEEEPAIADPPHPRDIGQIRGQIEFRGVTIRHSPDGPAVLDRLDLTIEAGTTVAIVGETGSGKTTLVDALARLVDPDEGAVLVDGVDVRELSLRDLRAAIGFVPQEAMLFSDSLRENVAFGRVDASDDEIAQAVEISKLSNDLEQFAAGMDTVIGERGISLSGGQRQRATLARALVADLPILVLDDSLSHVDTHTEEEILNGLREYMHDRTTIMIAHRTSALAAADRVVVLDGGRIVEDGTHDELVAHGGVYARLYHRQQRFETLVDAGLVEDAAVVDGDERASAGSKRPQGGPA